MTRFAWTKDVSDLAPEISGLDGAASRDPGEKGRGGDLGDLVSILAFLRREIDQSAMILHDLTGRLSHELCALGMADEDRTLQPRLSAAACALQNEDRVQQRLCDLRAVLTVLEQALTHGHPALGPDLDQAILGRLILEEMRGAFAIGVGMTDTLPPPSRPATAPSVGEIDLF